MADSDPAVLNQDELSLIATQGLAQTAFAARLSYLRLTDEIPRMQGLANCFNGFSMLLVANEASKEPTLYTVTDDDQQLFMEMILFMVKVSQTDKYAKIDGLNEYMGIGKNTELNGLLFSSLSTANKVEVRKEMDKILETYQVRQ